MEILQKLFFIITAANWVSCTIDGLSYMDDIKQRYLDNDKKFPRGEDPCNPLYWYPKSIPESCQFKEPPLMPKTETPPPLPVPIPVPMEPYPFPVPAPMPYPAPLPPMPAPMPPMPPMPFMPMPGPIPMPGPLLPIPAPMPMPPLPYGIPIQPSSPILPVLSNSFPMQPPPFPAPSPFPMPQQPYPMPSMGPAASGHPQYGFMPGIPGMVSHGGGINIMPFSDVYSELLEKHKQKMMRKEMQQILDKYNRKHRHSRGRQYN